MHGHARPSKIAPNNVSVPGLPQHRLALQRSADNTIAPKLGHSFPSRQTIFFRFFFSLVWPQKQHILLSAFGVCAAESAVTNRSPRVASASEQQSNTNQQSQHHLSCSSQPHSAPHTTPSSSVSLPLLTKTPTHTQNRRNRHTHVPPLRSALPPAVPRPPCTLCHHPAPRSSLSSLTPRQRSRSSLHTTQHSKDASPLKLVPRRHDGRAAGPLRLLPRHPQQVSAAMAVCVF